MLILYTLMGILSVLCVNTGQQVTEKLFTITPCPHMSNSKDQPNGCINEISLRKLAKSSGFSETEILYAFHTLAEAGYYKELK